ncbi:MAG: hypothetical protein GON13_02120 [Nanoarchaeota archaeon]|nr:hypothetical protein [Nanoarchaeota archaeon]
MSENLMSGLMRELKRNRILLKEYELIGAPGMFGATLLKQDIEEADNAIETGDTIGMMVCYSKLKENK